VIRIEARERLGIVLSRLGRTEEAADVLQAVFEDLLGRISCPGAEELRTAWPKFRDAQVIATDTAVQDGLHFDGDGDFVVIPRLNFDGRPSWTIEVVLNPAALEQSVIRGTSRWTSLVSTADGGGIGLESEQGKWEIGMYSRVDPKDPTNEFANAVASHDVALREWQHVAGIWDGSELRLYINGRLEGRAQHVTSCSALSKWPFYIGADPCDPWHGHLGEGLFEGVIRAVRISRGVEYTADFSQPERLDKTADTVALYDFTIDTGRYALDRSGHGHNGIIVGAKFVPAEENAGE
jgi:hypothetical protein